jgi:predicted outer membrane repeat protein
VITDNLATHGGGAHAHGTNEAGPEGNSPNFVNCAFLGNKASGVAGGMCSASADSKLVNCTFSGNLAALGAGLYIAGANFAVTTTVSDCTFSRNGNGSTSGGGGIRAAQTVVIENCIL